MNGQASNKIQSYTPFTCSTIDDKTKIRCLFPMNPIPVAEGHSRLQVSGLNQRDNDLILNLLQNRSLVSADRSHLPVWTSDQDDGDISKYVTSSNHVIPSLLVYLNVF
jgi:hypothetical protein